MWSVICAGHRGDDDGTDAGTDPVRRAQEHLQEQGRVARQRDVYVRSGIRGRILPDGRVRRLLQVRNVLAVGGGTADVPVLGDQLRRPV